MLRARNCAKAEKTAMEADSDFDDFVELLKELFGEFSAEAVFGNTKKLQSEKGEGARGKEIHHARQKAPSLGPAPPVTPSSHEP